jgi:hypothetical protein
MRGAEEKTGPVVAQPLPVDAEASDTVGTQSAAGVGPGRSLSGS